MKVIVFTKEELQQIIEETTEKTIDSVYKRIKESESDEIFITIEEAAKLIRVTEQTIRNYIKEGKIEARKIKRRVLISRTKLLSDLDEIKSIKYKR